LQNFLGLSVGYMVKKAVMLYGISINNCVPFPELDLISKLPPTISILSLISIKPSPLLNSSKSLIFFMLKPLPLSLIKIQTLDFLFSRRRYILLAHACLDMFVKASWIILKITISISLFSLFFKLITLKSISIFSLFL